MADPLAWRQTLARLARQSLARIDQRGLQLHRLIQAILRDRLTPEQSAVTRKCSEAILAASDPRDPDNPVTWPRWARLMPHLIAADLAAAENPGLREMACNACYYLLSRGETRTGYDLASELRQHWRGRLGDDDLDTLAVTYYLAWALRDMGRYAEARDLNQDTLDRSRRLLGEDDLSTLNSASNLAMDLRMLGEVRAARDLDQDTLDRRRRVLGEDHPLTLASAYHLAADLRELREVGDTSDRDASGRMAFDITEDDRSGDLPESPGVALFLVGLTACRISDSEAALTGPSWRATCSEADEAPVSVRARPVPSALGRLERRCATVAVDKPRTSGLIRWPAASAGPACAGRASKAEPGAAPGRGGAQRSRLDNHYN